MADEMSESLFELQWKAFNRSQLDDAELVEMFEAGRARVTEGVDSYERKFRHVIKKIRLALNDRETNPAILTRRYAGLMQQMEGLHDAVFAMRSGYADIWTALEEALQDAPLKAISSQARRGYEGKLAKNEKTKAQDAAMAIIRAEWRTMFRSKGKHLTDAAFARSVYSRFADVITNEGSIKNAISRWRQQESRHPAG